LIGEAENLAAMTFGAGNLRELIPGRGVAAGDDDDLERPLNVQERCIDFFDGPDAESACGLKDDRAIAIEFLPLENFLAIFRLREERMNRDTSDGDVFACNSP